MIPVMSRIWIPAGNNGRIPFTDCDVTVYSALDYTTNLGGSLGGNFFIAYSSDPIGTSGGSPSNDFESRFQVFKTGNINTGGTNVYINGLLNGGQTPQVSDNFTWTHGTFVKFRFVWRSGIGVYVYADDVLVYKNEYAFTAFSESHLYFGSYGAYSTTDGWATFRDIDAKEYGTANGWTLNCRSGYDLGAYTLIKSPGLFSQQSDGLDIRGTFSANYGAVRFD